MESAMLALLVGAFGVGLMLYQDHYQRSHVARDSTDGAVSGGGPRFPLDDGSRHADLGVTMTFDTPCPRCDGTPVEILEMVDGKGLDLSALWPPGGRGRDRYRCLRRQARLS